MKKVGIGIAAIFVAAGCTLGGIQAKKGIDNYVKKQAQEIVTQYEQKDKQWTKENYEETISQEQLLTAFNSTYYVLNEVYYKTIDGDAKEKSKETVSGILLNGDYLLTVKHVVGEERVSSIDPFFQRRLYPHNNFSLTDKVPSDAKNKYALEEIFISENLDYALLKLKDGAIPYYPYGFSLSDKIELCMQSVAIGFPAGKQNRNLRLGSVSQLESDFGEEYLTFKNTLIPGDSGGPIFVVKDGNLKLVAIATDIGTISDPNDKYSSIRHPISINYGLKISKIIEDLELQLDSGRLDGKTSKEIKNFLELNKE